MSKEASQQSSKLHLWSRHAARCDKNVGMSKTAPGLSLNNHFEGKDLIVHRIYDAIVKSARQWGPVKEDPKKTSIHLNNVSAFAGIVTRKSHLVLTLKSNHKISSARIHKSEQTSASRFHSELKLSSPDEVDSELLVWLKEAYALSS